MKGTCGWFDTASCRQGFTGGLVCVGVPNELVWCPPCKAYSFEAPKRSLGTKLLRFTFRYNILTHITVLWEKERFWGLFGYCWLGFDCKLWRQGLLPWVPVGCGNLLAFSSILLNKTTPCSEEGVTGLSNIPVQKQGYGPNSASCNHLWAESCCHLHPGAWAVGAGIIPEWVIQGAKSSCQYESGLFQFNGSLLWNIWWFFVLKDSASDFMLLHLNLAL